MSAISLYKEAAGPRDSPVPPCQVRVTTQLATLLQDALGPDYRLEHELEGGGMSRLFMATDVRHNRNVVVKVLAPELVSDLSTARFKREIELTVRLQHPHILPILTSGAYDDVLYYITPFIPGESLRARIAREGKLPLNDIVKILRDASGALAFAHGRGVAHRDIKPGNILLAEGHAILGDFGIARATATQGTPLTGSGMNPGTPAYMAPELPTDEKADVYALGIVGYEMLCGALPKRGVTCPEILTARGRVEGDDRQRLAALATLVADAMSAAVDTRTASAESFCESVSSLQPGVTRTRNGRPALVAAVLAAAVVAGVFGRRWHRAELDPSRFAVVTLTPSVPETQDVARRVERAIAEWRGVTVIDDALVTSTLRRRPGQSLQLTDLRELGRRVDARNVVGVDVRFERDSTVIRASLFDATADSVLKIRDAAYARVGESFTEPMVLRRLVNGLLRSGEEMPWRSPTDSSAAVLPAWRSYDRGRDAIANWDLTSAEKSFRDAISNDPKLALAHLWLAQTLVWAEGAKAQNDARSSARRSLEQRTGLGARDSLHAAALLALSSGLYPAACRAFHRLVDRDSSDLSGWLGMGDCQAADGAVVRDAHSRTGWAFRGSYAAAARCFQRANELGPFAMDSPFRGWLLGRMTAILFPITNHVRIGHSVDSAASVFASFPFLDHDSLAFAPYHAAQLERGTEDPPPAMVQAAVTRNRQLLREAAEEWVRHSPQSPAAYDSLASLTELSGGYATIGEQQLGTLGVVRRALLYSRDSTQRLRLAISEVRLLLKQQQFSAARVEADSLLQAGATKRAAAVPGVAGLSALVGRLEQTVVLLSVDRDWKDQPLADGSTVSIPAQVAEAASRLLVYSAMGGSVDTVRLAARRTGELITSYFPNAVIAGAVRSALVPHALLYAYPETRALLASPQDGTDDLVDAVHRLAVGDPDGAREKLAEIRRGRAGRLPGTSIENDLLRARLALSLGDTVSAMSELDPVLRALPTLAPTLLSRVAQTASLVRALALRAELADRRGDPTSAKQCAGAVVALWQNADPPLQPLIARMKALSH